MGAGGYRRVGAQPRTAITRVPRAFGSIEEKGGCWTAALASLAEPRLSVSWPAASVVTKLGFEPAATCEGFESGVSSIKSPNI